MKRTGLLLLLGMIIVGLAGAQSLPGDLERARQSLDSGQAEAALASVQQYLAQHPAGDYTVAAHLLAGRAELQLNRVAEALRRGYGLLSQLPLESPYQGDVHFLLAAAQQARGDAGDASSELVAVLDSNPSPELHAEALNKLTELLNGPAAYRANDLLLSARREGTRRILRKLLPVSAEQPVLGLLLPGDLSGEADWRELEAGVRAALRVWQEEGGARFELEVVDAGLEPARAVAAARDLVRKSGVWALIVAGPEELVVPAAVEAQAAGIPVIVPGSGQTALAGIGPGIVQSVADWRLEGQLAATYAVEVLGKRVFGIVAPYTDRGRETVAGFLSVLEQHVDVEVLDQEWYRPEEGVSLVGQFRKLRTIGFKREFRNRMIAAGIARRDSIGTMLDSLGGIEVEGQLDSQPWDSLKLSRRRIESAWQQHLIEARQTIEFKTGKVDSNAIALNIYDALYLPIEAGTIPIFAPQFAFYEFNTVRMGNSAWHDPDELLRHRQYVERLIFTSPMYLQDDNRALDELRHTLSDSLNGSPEQWHVFGYDAAELILCAASGCTPEDTSAAREIRCAGPLDIGVALRNLRRADLAEGVQHFAEGSATGRGVWFLSVSNGEVIPLLDGLQTLSTLPDAVPPPWLPQQSNPQSPPEMQPPGPVTGANPSDQAGDNE